MSRPVQLTIMASGSGTNAENIISTLKGSDLAEVALILTDNPKAGVLERADRLNTKSLILSPEEHKNGKALNAILRKVNTDILVLAGYLKLIPRETVEEYRSRIVNVHPSLLPKFGGKGMYGMKVHEAVIEAKEIQSGITIHHVNEQYDEGDIIDQQFVSIIEGWTPEDLAKAIHQLEYKHFPRVIQELCRTHLQEKSNNQK